MQLPSGQRMPDRAELEKRMRTSLKNTRSYAKSTPYMESRCQYDFNASFKIVLEEFARAKFLHIFDRIKREETDNAWAAGEQ